MWMYWQPLFGYTNIYSKIYFIFLKLKHEIYKSIK